ncbi:porin [Vibrio sp. S17_S38]|uniref:porin n=1 Tax=Vibrio sp. S17_S38 TaxID=2720229 RepID=UPI001680BD37|nr:porin [Vibrio sp. S17_S38]MBD1571765.1 porin [Vibrio sp. S17_S38]
MKKTYIALAIAALATAAGANAATVYKTDATQFDIGGRAEFRGDFIGTDGGDKIDGTMHNASRFRINFAGETKITDNLSGIGFYEAEQGVNSSGDNSKGTDGTDFNQRYVFAGFKTNVGNFTFGRQDTSTVMISQMSDISTYSGAQKTFIASGDEQVNNNIQYAGNFLQDALTVKANVILGDTDNSDGYGVAAKYTLPMGLGLALGYAANDIPDTVLAQDGQSADQLIAGVNYTIGGLYAAATYTTGDLNDNDDFDGVETSVQYKWDNGFRVIGAYQYQEAESETINNWFELTGGYDFTDNLYAYVSYKLNNLDQGDSTFSSDTYQISGATLRDAEDSMRLGLLYTF